MSPCVGEEVRQRWIRSFIIDKAMLGISHAFSLLIRVTHCFI